MRTKVIASKPEINEDGEITSNSGIVVQLTVAEERDLDQQEAVQSIKIAKRTKREEIKNDARVEFKKIDHDLNQEIIKGMRLLLPGLDQTKLNAKAKRLINIDKKMRALLKLVKQAATIDEINSISFV